jgi:hypothetical protein
VTDKIVRSSRSKELTEYANISDVMTSEMFLFIEDIDLKETDAI